VNIRKLLLISILFLLPILLTCGEKITEPTGPSENTCSLTVTSPTSSSNWTVGQPRSITWSTSGTCGENVMIELYKGTLRSCTIENSTPNDGSEGWVVSNCGISGTDYRIKITIIDSDISSFSGYFRYNTR
jgi:hypothetical protein